MRMAYERGDVGGNVHLLVTDAEHDGTAVARDHDLVRAGCVQNGEPVCALYVFQRSPYSVDQRLGGLGCNQVCEQFGVGVGRKRRTVRGQTGSKFRCILDDPVVYDRDAAARISVRVSVCVARRAVRCPARVADPHGRTDALWQTRFEVADAALGFERRELATPVHGDPGGVVPAIFEAAKAFDENGNCVVVADVSEDATHKSAASSCLPDR